MKVLITGALGQVGQEVTLLCKEKSFEVLPYSSQELDITKEQDVSGILTKHKPDFVINCAAYTKVDLAEDEKEKAFLVNASGVKFLANACKHLDIPMIHISTDYVFDGKKNVWYVEEDIANPLNIYGASKWQGEELLRSSFDKHIILRVSWVFGRFGNNFVKTISRLAKERLELKIVADQKGSPTGASHISEVILKIIEHPNLKDHWGTYHYTDAPVTNWYDFAKAFIDPKQCSILPILANEYPLKAIRPQNSVLNCDKIAKVFGIKQAPWQQELKRMHDISN